MTDEATTAAEADAFRIGFGIGMIFSGLLALAGGLALRQAYHRK